MVFRKTPELLRFYISMVFFFIFIYLREHTNAHTEMKFIVLIYFEGGRWSMYCEGGYDVRKYIRKILRVWGGELR